MGEKERGREVEREGGGEEEGREREGGREGEMKIKKWIKKEECVVMVVPDRSE